MDHEELSGPSTYPISQRKTGLRMFVATLVKYDANYICGYHPISQIIKQVHRTPSSKALCVFVHWINVRICFRLSIEVPQVEDAPRSKIFCAADS